MADRKARPFSQAAWNSASKAPPARAVSSWSQSSGDRLRITAERVRKARSTSVSPSMPKPVPSSVTMVRKLGTPASFHVGSPPLIAYSVKRGVSCSSNGPTSTSTEREEVRALVDIDGHTRAVDEGEDRIAPALLGQGDPQCVAFTNR